MVKYTVTRAFKYILNTRILSDLVIPTNLNENRLKILVK